MEKERQRKHRALIHRAHRPLSWEHWERPLFVHSYHGESGFQARLGLSWKIRWNQSVLNLFCGRGLESASPAAAFWNETIRSTGGSVGEGAQHGEQSELETLIVNNQKTPDGLMNSFKFKKHIQEFIWLIKRPTCILNQGNTPVIVLCVFLGCIALFNLLVKPLTLHSHLLDTLYSNYSKWDMQYFEFRVVDYQCI